MEEEILISEPTIKYTKEEAIKKFKLDRRHKWFVFYGNLCYSQRFTMPCSGCDGGGCSECGYTGKRRSACPIPAMDDDNNLIEVIGENFS